MGWGFHSQVSSPAMEFCSMMGILADFEVPAHGRAGFGVEQLDLGLKFQEEGNQDVII